MAQELAMVTVGVISAISVLAGSICTWLLNNISATETAKRLEQSAVRHSIEEKYLMVLSGTELFLRSKLKNMDLETDLAHLNAVIRLFANDDVKKKHRAQSDAVVAYQDVFYKSQKNFESLSDGSEEFSQEWRKLMVALEELSGSMSAHIQSLKSFPK
ncbi:hypothetical protein [Pseudomonas sp. TAF7]|uniref:hypothetical protein n=1 Tax=Pseudomonas sp. TAF7 TaxID=3233073 RepID=UPI003F943544